MSISSLSDIRSPRGFHLDREHLLNLVASDRELVKTLLTTYLTASGSEVSTLLQAITTDDVEVTARYAHKIRGSLRYLGARRIEAMLCDVETAARAYDLQTLRTHYRPIESDYRQLELEIRHWLTEL
ncbi:Hpt domain-containing protein [Pseudaeromonas sharmana]|uniref:Hpt domain-containing protein n=1 Tax=Pseudaeromonas sharmana TaxID=328412 RepID=A0ABV8CNY9_9GAMM